MKVYIYEQGCRYEGGQVRGVFSNKESAVAEAKNHLEINEFTRKNLYNYIQDQTITINDNSSKFWSATTCYEFWSVTEYEVKD